MELLILWVVFVAWLIEQIPPWIWWLAIAGAVWLCILLRHND